MSPSSERNQVMWKTSQPDTAGKLAAIAASARPTKDGLGKGIKVSLEVYVSKRLIKFIGPNGETICISRPNGGDPSESFIDELVRLLGERVDAK
jgi:hypothetical protein